MHVAEERGDKGLRLLGEIEGGFSTKVQVSADALGNPLRFTLTGGSAHDITQACELIDGTVHHSVILEFDLPSYRTSEAQNRQTEDETDRQN